MGMLRDRMIEEMTLRNFAPDTQKSYLNSVVRLTKFYRRSPDQLSQEEIRSYLLYLINECKLAPTTVTTIMAGLRFFFNQTLGWDDLKHSAYFAMLSVLTTLFAFKSVACVFET